VNLDAVITQLRSAATSFGGRVAGAANFAEVVENEVQMDLPAAYVIPLEDEAEPNEQQPGLHQVITERIGVVLHLTNAASAGGDRRGQAPVRGLDDLRLEVFAAILNWRPATAGLPSSRAFEYASGRLLDFDRARLFWQMEFTLETTVTDSDGWQATAEDLEEIDVHLTSADGAVTITGAAATDLQS